MPKPNFILCAQHYIESKESNLLTLIDICEVFDITVGDKPEDQPVVYIPWNPFKAIAVWRLMPEDDPGANYESDWVVVLPSGETIVSADTKKPSFSHAKPLWRAVMLFITPLPIKQSGTLRVISRMRKDGGEWITQEHEIMCKVNNPPVSQPIPDPSRN